MAAKTPRADPLEAELERERAARVRAERTAKALREVSLALGSTLDHDDLLELIVRNIAEAIDAERATLFLLDEHRDRLVARVALGDGARQIELPVGQGIAGHVAATGKATRVKDAYADRRFQAEWDRLSGYRTRSILAAPMKNHLGHTIGVVQALNKRATPEQRAAAAKRRAKTGGTDADADHYTTFTAADEETLAALATQAAVSIVNSRLFVASIQKNLQLLDTKEQLEQRVAALKLLFELENATGRASTLEELARATVVTAARACDASTGALLAHDEEAGLLLFHVDPELDTEGHSNLGDAPAMVRRFPLKRGQGLVGLAYQRNEAVSFPAPGIRAALGEGEQTVSRRGLPGMNASTAIAIPLGGEEDTPIGALALYDSRRPEGFTPDDRALLRLIAANVSTALQLFRSKLAAERSERLLTIGRLLSGVLHDLRTPLVVIRTAVRLMTECDDRTQRHHHAQQALRQFEALQAMQKEVLEFARGERSVLVRKVYLGPFFGDLERDLARDLAVQGASLELELRDKGTARFDEAKLTRALHNLARNAAEAMPTGGIVRIRVEKNAGQLVVSVTDTGPGIPEAVQARLFQPFATHGKQGGTGLGLATVKKIVDEHGGTISVVTSSRGTRFTITLPQAEPEPAA